MTVIFHSLTLSFSLAHTHTDTSRNLISRSAYLLVLEMFKCCFLKGVHASCTLIPFDWIFRMIFVQIFTHAAMHLSRTTNSIASPFRPYLGTLYHVNRARANDKFRLSPCAPFHYCSSAFHKRLWDLCKCSKTALKNPLFSQWMHRDAMVSAVRVSHFLRTSMCVCVYSISMVVFSCRFLSGSSSSDHHFLLNDNKTELLCLRTKECTARSSQYKMRTKNGVCTASTDRATKEMKW